MRPGPAAGHRPADRRRRRRGGRAIEVDTRTAVASVRSTEWLVESTDKGTGVLAIVGEVTVRGLAGGRGGSAPGRGHRRGARRRAAAAGDLGRGAAPGCDCPHHDLSRGAAIVGRGPGLARAAARGAARQRRRACASTRGSATATCCAALELQTLDWRFRLRGPEPPGGEVVLVLADDATVAELGAWPPPRAAARRGHRPAGRGRCRRDRGQPAARRGAGAPAGGGARAAGGEPARPLPPDAAPLRGRIEAAARRRRPGRRAGGGDRRGRPRGRCLTRSCSIRRRRTSPRLPAWISAHRLPGPRPRAGAPRRRRWRRAA